MKHSPSEANLFLYQLALEPEVVCIPQFSRRGFLPVRGLAKVHPSANQTPLGLTLLDFRIFTSSHSKMDAQCCHCRARILVDIKIHSCRGFTSHQRIAFSNQDPEFPQRALAQTCYIGNRCTTLVARSHTFCPEFRP